MRRDWELTWHVRRANGVKWKTGSVTSVMAE